MKNTIKENEKKLKEYERSFKNIKKENIKMKDDLIIVKKELKLIKLRDVIKNIIDLFCNSFQIRRDISYADKIKEIKNKILLTIAKENAFELRAFFEKIYSNFQASIRNAHSIELNQSIIEQLFTEIDTNGDLSNVKERLLKGNIDSLLLKLGIQRNLYSKDKTKLKEEEEKIINSVVTLNEIYP